MTSIEESEKPGGKPSFIYCSGTAGVGKTFVIDCIADAVQLKYGDDSDASSKPAVLLGAPTALTAILIRGQTLHSLFGIQVKNGTEAGYEPLRDDQRDLRRSLFAKIKVIIIDEISMCGAVMLAKINNRLREIKIHNQQFGAVNIVVFGDMLQLPPVQALPVFTDVLISTQIAVNI
ncbi:unnamed protein product [Caenorhabditis sp. 36 PRJEB53466]|nr:unnamed protein product [Caenorhabditis sp. 36 PRJEB53466]